MNQLKLAIYELTAERGYIQDNLIYMQDINKYDDVVIEKMINDYLKSLDLENVRQLDEKEKVNGGKWAFIATQKTGYQNYLLVDILSVEV
ncbi:hypothetical protein EOQ17_12940 [Staphylococcus pseudintermedius]|uniref:hypothetical protein n=1 Tax=Staphylococcus pseudintermedius TaxID=283734 RepID=UPI00111F66BF|nr:hypothetical protein [Staphylococcus pseudintermedius]EGQ2888056.1 hypothetical protein [Staphylococcus pseudintermedius]EGQ3561226.1 hypothetical protein [Staphylococcus pseudintermedius]EGQ4125724.1 hypothetical protein [Staphylococcus pseudintermedius]EHD5242403.1 hypothetical protein [Staphylococcus pseudintermedius]EHT8042667.1 hypothetical protein [Staphylococcus pseudintermedius]